MQRRKLSTPNEEKIPKSAAAAQKERVSVSWDCLTTNKAFHFGHFGDNRIRDELTARRELDKLLQVLTRLTWMEILQKKKYDFGGAETLHSYEVNFSPSDIEVSEDTKYFSFRFCKQDYRMLGLKIGNVLHIIGFDFNHDAYNHGS